MIINVDGHSYQLSNMDNPQNTQSLNFINMLPDGTRIDGTTNEEVIEVLLNRMNYLNGKFPCRENSLVITKLDEALMWLQKRTSDRVKRGVEGKHLA